MLKVYAKRYCAGYEKGDEVEVYDVYSGKYNGSILFLIWSPKLKKWAWGHASVDEYLMCKRYDYMAFKSWDDVFDVLEKYLSDEEFENLPESESECRKHYDELPWTKAIIVYVTAAD